MSHKSAILAHKSPAIYKSSDNINNFKIRIQLREVSEGLKGNEQELNEIRVFSWQEKVYGKFEREFYKDSTNCVTDLEKRYRRDILKLDSQDGVLFTYVGEDELCNNDERNVSDSNAVSKLCKEVKNLSLAQENGPRITKDLSDLKNTLIDSLKGPHGDSNIIETMHILADLGEYINDTWLKSEHILCTIKYIRETKSYFIFPDFTQTHPYSVQIEGDCNKTYHYTIQDASEKVPADVSLKESEILNKISAHEIKVRLSKIGSDFEKPLKNKLNIYLFCEILNARNFEYNDIFVQYFVDLPEGYFCKNSDSLKGATQTSHAFTEDNLAYFGFPFELSLEFNIQTLGQSGILKGPHIYFEVISKGTWDRFRTEGLTYTILPVSQPGIYNYNLHCLRINSRGPSSELRRFFIGDCSSHSDLTWISLPKDHDKRVVNKYGVNTVGTGEIKLRINVVHQSQVFVSDRKENSREEFILDKLNASSFAKSVEQVIEAFKVAKRKMIEARKGV